MTVVEERHSADEKASRLLRSWNAPPLLIAALAVLGVKLVWFAIDRVPLFFMGDSRAYIDSALFGQTLLDRSNTYGWLIRMISVVPGTLTTLVLAQTLAGAVTAWLLAFCLLRYFRISPFVAVAAAIAFAAEPMQILHERMVLTESFAMLMLASYLTLGLCYLARPRAMMLVAIAACGVLLLSLRLVYVPVTLICAVFIPLLTLMSPRRDSSRAQRKWRLVGHLLVSLIVTLALHDIYRGFTGRNAKLPPAYQYADGFFLATAWGPLIEPDDAADPRARGVIRDMLVSPTYPLRDFNTRVQQLWGGNGTLAHEMIVAFGGDSFSANAAAKQMSMRTLRRVPLSVLRVTAMNFAGYWRGLARMRDRLLDEQGTSRVPAKAFLSLLKERFNVDASQTGVTMTPSKRYHLVGAPWYFVLTLSPLIGVLGVLCARADARPGAVMIVVVGGIIIGVSCMVSVSTTARYLHPLVFGTLVAMAVIADAGLRRASGRA